MKKINPINIKLLEGYGYKNSNKIRTSMILYNKAIADIKKDCIEAAIHDLKKSLKINPDFSEAIKLLGLCYVKIHDFNKARKVFKKLIKYDIQGTVSNEYLNEIRVEKNASKAIDAIRTYNLSLHNKKDHNFKPPKHRFITSKIGRGWSITSIVSLVFIVIIAGLAYLIHSNFSITQSKAYNQNKIVVSSVQVYNESENTKITNEENIQLNEDNKNLQMALNSTKSELEDYKNQYNIFLQLNNAENFCEQRDYEKEVECLLTLKNQTLDDTAKTKFNKLWNDVVTNYIWSIYKSGNGLYKKGKYQEALPKIKMVLDVAPDQELMPFITYQLGNCYKETNDYNNALILFQNVIDKYPTSIYSNYSKNMINKI
jgi:tetratricopeptide (TPR) repeat protein